MAIEIGQRIAQGGDAQAQRARIDRFMRRAGRDEQCRRGELVEGGDFLGRQPGGAEGLEGVEQGEGRDFHADGVTTSPLRGFGLLPLRTGLFVLTPRWRARIGAAARTHRADIEIQFAGGNGDQPARCEFGGTKDGEDAEAQIARQRIDDRPQRGDAGHRQKPKDDALQHIEIPVDRAFPVEGEAVFHAFEARTVGGAVDGK